VAPVKTYTMVKKVTEIYGGFRENRGKIFFFGGNFPLNGGKAVEKKVVMYMGGRVLRDRGSIMSIFKKKFQCVTFCAFLMTLLILWELWEPKVGSFVLFFSLNIM